MMTSAGPEVAQLALTSCSGFSICDVTDGQNVDPVILDNYRIEIGKLQELLSTFSAKWVSWKIVLDKKKMAEVKHWVTTELSIVQVTCNTELPAVQDTCNCNTEQQCRLYSLTQMSVYAYFLKTHLNHRDYGIHACADIQEIVIRQLKATCLLKQLLQPEVSNDDIFNFVKKHFTRPAVSFKGKTPLEIRAFTILAVDLMNTTMSSSPFFVCSLKN
ncbi:uncharacterized protein LOC131936796 [Physella acuta]|uniref:uncharacterized protein LOC131936796 n=1 Tax=Physella acuta TaxID=109671 RepID=UPI0027DBEEBE|nr:uncharacterized protein LOC131936796 [Physella acuta]XP_059149858.1 uncharacterized protein LOC131936796 [Physella acuta]